jgi:hypothetical protein
MSMLVRFFLVFLMATGLLYGGSLADLKPHGFLEFRLGTRLDEDPNQDRAAIMESRFQLELSHYGSAITWQLKTDFYWDGVLEQNGIDLEQGQGWADLREAYGLGTPAAWMDLKVGRQVLTWGTGDLVFINDLFPKDWQSFLIGRDTTYLKAPSDAVYASPFPSWANIDVVYTPRFDADRYIRGERISYFNPLFGQVTGQNAILETEIPSEWFEDDELAVRIYRNVKGWELAAYYYDGFWKSPGGFNPINGKARFPSLRTVGASARGSLAGGVFNAEIGWLESKEDKDGADPFVNNSELRWLLGYEMELATNFTGSFQYYAEQTQDYDGYLAGLPNPELAKEEIRHNLTARFTYFAFNQNLELSLFLYGSPNESDIYLRPRLNYKVNQDMAVFIGGNLFHGADSHTFFGQFEDATNLYAGWRLSF